ncbi:MAG: preprotein translocase subunit YajC [Oscillospiraceae bacterium]|nr:preprotein translocase subunit YajC [Oscillospiraceae bacterium]
MFEFTSQAALFLTGAGTPEATPVADASSQSSPVSMLIMFLPLILIMYFFWIRPENKRKKEAAKMLNELLVGDEITTIGGISGKLVSVDNETAVIETGPERTRIQILRKAIASVAQKEKA